MTDFTPGTKLRVIDADRNINRFADVPPFKLGDIVTVVAPLPGTSDGYVWLEEHLNTGCWRSDRFEVYVETPRELQVGDTVRVVKPTEVSLKLKKGAIHKVSAAGALTWNGTWCVALDGETNLQVCGWRADRFELVEEEVKEVDPLNFSDCADLMKTATRVVVIPDDVNALQIPTRSYDYRQGDRRFTNAQTAIAYAEAEQRRTGVQQVVRRDPGSYDFQELILVQAMGS